MFANCCLLVSAWHIKFKLPKSYARVDGLPRSLPPRAESKLEEINTHKYQFPLAPIYDEIVG